MLVYILRRLLATVPVMALVMLIIFSLLFIAPGDPAALIAGDQATSEDLARIRAKLGLDEPFVTRFAEWAWNVIRLDLGTSIFTNTPVTELIAQRTEATLSLMALTLLISVTIAIPMGVLAAWKVGSVFDRFIMSFAVFGFSLPVFVVGYLLAFVLGVQLDWVPIQGYVPLEDGLLEWLSRIILPALTLSCGYIALIARITRAAMLEVLQQDYVRTGRAKGVNDGRLLFVHALKNASIPIVTVVGLGVASLIGGAVATESVFAIPGLGRLVVDAIMRRDYPVIQGVVLLCSFVYVMVNLLVDISYSLFDPRIRY